MRMFRCGSKPVVVGFNIGCGLHHSVSVLFLLLLSLSSSSSAVVSAFVIPSSSSSSFTTSSSRRCKQQDFFFFGSTSGHSSNININQKSLLSSSLLSRCVSSSPTGISISSSSALRYSKGGINNGGSSSNDESSLSSNSTTTTTTTVDGTASASTTATTDDVDIDLEYALGIKSTTTDSVEEDDDDYFYADFGLRREPNNKDAFDGINEQSILEARLEYAETYVDMMQEQVDDMKTGQFYSTLSKQKEELMDQLDSKSKALEELQESFHQLELQLQSQELSDNNEAEEEESTQEQQRLLQNLITTVELQQVWMMQQDQYIQSKASQEHEQQQRYMEESYESQKDQLEEQINDLMNELNGTKSQLLELQQQRKEQQREQQEQQQKEQRREDRQIIIGHEIVNSTSTRENNDHDEIQNLKEQNRKLQRQMEQSLMEQKQLRSNEQADSRAKQYKFESIIKSKVYDLERSLDEKVHEVNGLKSKLNEYARQEQDWISQQNELESTIAEVESQVRKERQASQGYNVDLSKSQDKLKKFQNEQSKKLAKLENELRLFEKKENVWAEDKRELESNIKQSRSDIQTSKLESRKYQSDIQKLEYQVKQLETKLELSEKKKGTATPVSQKQQQQQRQKKTSATTPEPAKPVASTVATTTTTTTAEIRQWYLNTKNEVCGIVYNHPTLEDGAEITTSPILQPKMANDYAVVETASRSKYRLGRKSTTATALQQQQQLQRRQVQKTAPPPPTKQDQQQHQQDLVVPQMPSFSNMTDMFFPQSSQQQQKKKQETDDSSAKEKQKESSSSSSPPQPKRKQPPRPSFQNIFTQGRLSSQQQRQEKEQKKPLSPPPKESSTGGAAADPSAAATAASKNIDVVANNKRKQPPRPSFRNIFTEGRLSQQQQQQNKATTTPSSEKLPEIRNWYLNEKHEVCGIVYGHQALEDGEVIVSSALSQPKLARDFATVETGSGSKYRLGRQERRPSIKNKMEEAEAKASPQVQKPSTAASRAHATPSFSNMTNIFFPQHVKPANSTVGGSTTKDPKEDPVVATTKDKRKQEPRPSFPNIFEGSISSSQKDGSHHDPRGASSSTLLDETKKQKAVDVDTAATSPTPIRKKLPLTGKQLGNGKYLFAGKIRSSANGRCQIISAYHRQNIDPNAETSTPDDDDRLVIVKISDNIDAMEREHSNFKKLWSGQQKGHIVQCHDYFKKHEDESKSYLILERGEEDLKQRRHRLVGSGTNDEDELRAALLAAVKCMDSFHSSRLVWTDLKSENFVLVKDENDDELFKAIDLESAVPLKGNPLDFTPEACPPEFAQAFVDGDPHSFVVDWHYDVWSFGMMAYELATRKGYYDNNNTHRIMKRLAGHDVPDLKSDIANSIANPKLADLISQCLNKDPKKRPNAQTLLRHPYFKASGSNFFGLSF